MPLDDLLLSLSASYCKIMAENLKLYKDDFEELKYIANAFDAQMDTLVDVADASKLVWIENKIMEAETDLDSQIEAVVGNY